MTQTELHELLAYRLQQMRKQRRYTQAEIAQAIGVTTQSLIWWETGKIQPKLYNLYKIARFYQVPVDKFLH